MQGVESAEAEKASGRPRLGRIFGRYGVDFFEGFAPVPMSCCGAFFAVDFAVSLLGADFSEDAVFFFDFFGFVFVPSSAFGLFTVGLIVSLLGAAAAGPPRACPKDGAATEHINSAENTITQIFICALLLCSSPIAKLLSVSNAVHPGQE